MKTYINISKKNNNTNWYGFNYGSKKELEPRGNIEFPGVGVAPLEDQLKCQMIPKIGYNIQTSYTYGNYYYVNPYNNSSITFVWIPKFYFKWDLKNVLTLSLEPKEGFHLHRAFINGGKEINGFFIQKNPISFPYGVAKAKGQTIGESNDPNIAFTRGWNNSGEVMGTFTTIINFVNRIHLLY